MIAKDERRLRIGVLGCGAIAQAGHFDACVKARNADLYAICDVAPDLVERIGWMHKPVKTYLSYDAMLADPEVEAIIIATADAFHVPAAIQALKTDKPVLCEKPLGVSVEEVEELGQVVRGTGKHLQVGYMKRFDAGLQAGKDYVDRDLGQLLAFKAWYCDSTHRYAMTDATQPVIVTSPRAKKPDIDPKADLRRYYMLAHGSHLVDTARFLGGEITEVQARLVERFGAYCWFVEVSFANGALGHLDLTIAVRMDWHEGFQLYGEHGSVVGKLYNPWYYKSSEVEIFHEADASYRRPLGADGHFYRRQVEAFADAVLHGRPSHAAGITDGIASVRTMVAIARSVEAGRPMRPAEVEGPV